MPGVKVLSASVTEGLSALKRGDCKKSAVLFPLTPQKEDNSPSKMYLDENKLLESLKRPVVALEVGNSIWKYVSLGKDC